ncbi:sulfur carrier protein ThiS [Maridesulfovibrio salexigens]|uniref:Thiamine biosynthesis protein ThiS n=1 Tax=Maridesulfovibrio salexigens (strain ATCC 14822 / DSM 2638 / NCIMB 8403 / VKM B-1763) TaxID=526222 RepID=C6BYU4_MARSD|nr:sulfur carrier protein ThiS [Maridesulfovibrio salexigens]ACS80701.1 thiamine biosynthesis protein ThiS [Maridesulfovibrio salexigens DSM 2638]
MIVKLNGKEAELAENITILKLLESKNLTPDTVVVELNMEIIPAENYGSTQINDGDHLEILRFVGGG